MPKCPGQPFAVCDRHAMQAVAEALTKRRRAARKSGFDIRCMAAYKRRLTKQNVHRSRIVRPLHGYQLERQEKPTCGWSLCTAKETSYQSRSKLRQSHTNNALAGLSSSFVRMGSRSNSRRRPALIVRLELVWLLAPVGEGEGREGGKGGEMRRGG